ncbi:unnamed protein product [Pleuronectes platessa]|uniref:Uncharacterized protein n=1 Tax=Pleuronectes platessa TaxID=8262 RepID=A0A9N7TN82_PLEPL|nr:unnamed protein product [Pleuronectes platessa]
MELHPACTRVLVFQRYPKIYFPVRSGSELEPACPGGAAGAASLSCPSCVYVGRQLCPGTTCRCACKL